MQAELDEAQCDAADAGHAEEPSWGWWNGLVGTFAEHIRASTTHLESGRS
ncbi:hypothetical protein ABIA33_007436 [Streptacidiphilus sp. MAP12-16]